MAVLTVAGFTACDKFLDSEPTTSLTEVNFYKTPADAEKAVIGCYDGLQQVWASGIAFPTASEIMSDNCFGGTGFSDTYGYQAIDEFDPQRSSSEVDLYNNNWVAYYKALYRCNMLIGKIDQINWNNQTALKNQKEAEARFIRAYLYFDMVRLWGNIPLVTKPTNENIPQAPADSVYKLIAKDLVFASANLISTPYSAGWAAANDGRATQWAAKALLARVYLYYTGYYGKQDLVGVADKATVLKGLEEVIGNGGFDLVSNFDNLWPAASAKANATNTDVDLSSYAGKGNKEAVFTIKYNITSDYDGNTDGNQWLVMLGLRSQAFFPYGKGWGACTVSPKLYNAYADNDKRKVSSIIAIAQEGLKFDMADQREYTGYSNKKYTPICLPSGKDYAEANGAVNFMIGQPWDYVSIRFADVLLMASELGSANAQNYFDRVLTRAGLTSIPCTPANIMEERRLEFAFEGIRYWDLLRQGVNVAAAALAENTKVKNGGVEVTKVVDASKFKATNGLSQIPKTQITLSNGVLKQNPGW